MGKYDEDGGYEVNLPTECPDNLSEAIEMLGNVKYVAWGFPVFFLHKDQGLLTTGWHATYRNTAKFKNPETESKSPLDACKKMHEFLLKLKKEGVKI